MNVASLFDGISCGHVAFDRAKIPVETYVASEIDKFAIKVTQHNYPKTIQIGNVETLDYEYLRNIGIDILIGGSPCQGFSYSGKRLNFDDPRSRLFFKYVEAKNTLQPKYFLLENVVMEKWCQDIISEKLGVQPIMIDSQLVSGAIRRRLYWTNIPVTSMPEDKHITFGDIRERNVPLNNMYYSEAAMDWIHRHEQRTGKRLRIIGDNDKMQMLEASMYKKYSSQRFFAIEDTHGLRYITPLECERCQTLPDNYTACVSNTQRYKQLGNGWTVDVIAFILSFIPEHDRV